MRYLLWIIAIVVLLVLNNGIFGVFHFSLIPPIALLPLVAAAVVAEDRPKVWLLAVVSGILLDFVSGLPDGIMLLSIIISVGFLMLLKSMFLRKEQHFLFVYAATGLMSLVFFLLILSINQLFILLGLSASRLETTYLLGMNLVWFVVLNIIVAFPVLYYYHFIDSLARKLPKTS